ncbi:DUF6476 family protein [Phaeovulum veldkampii]|nr:DUF6476 family protein [Phaeovulum veldkampii]
MSDMMPSDPNPAQPQNAPLPEVRFLKILVTALAATMIVGLVTIVTLLVIRLPGGGAQAPQAGVAAGGQTGALPALPASITLPDGAEVQAVTFARDLLVVVTASGEVLIYTPDGHLRQRVLAH